MLVSWWASELAAGENQPLASLPADWYLAAFPLLTVLTEILRFAQDDEWEAGRNRASTGHGMAP